jgi:hypothetical protein
MSHEITIMLILALGINLYKSLNQKSLNAISKNPSIIYVCAAIILKQTAIAKILAKNPILCAKMWSYYNSHPSTKPMIVALQNAIGANPALAFAYSVNPETVNAIIEITLTNSATTVLEQNPKFFEAISNALIKYPDIDKIIAKNPSFIDIIVTPLLQNPAFITKLGDYPTLVDAFIATINNNQAIASVFMQNQTYASRIISSFMRHPRYLDIFSANTELISVFAVSLISGLDIMSAWYNIRSRR